MYAWKNFSRQFLYLFVPAVAFFGLLVGYYYFSEVEKARVVLEANEALYLKLGKHVLEKDLETAVADLRVLAQHLEFDKIGNPLNPKALERLSREFLAFAQNKWYYDQIRFLDEAGREVIKINYSSRRPHVVPQDQLQDKSRRYYVNDTMRLKNGAIFISPMDLSVERGKVERPLKPIIRLSTPMFYGQEKKRGMVILNYLGASLIRGFKEAAVGAADHVMLLDADGFWKYSPRLELEWGAQLGHGLTFKKRFPEAWEQIMKADAGRYYSGAGLFVFDTVYPRRLFWKSSTGATVVDEPSPSQVKGKQYHWKVVAHVPTRDLNVAAATIARKLALIFVPLFVLLVAGVWWQAQVQVQRLKAEEVLRKRLRQQAAVAELGQRALSGVRLAALMETMVEYIAQVLEVEYCKILELLPDAERLLLRAGTGWRQGLVGRATVGAGMDSQAGYTLASNDPVIVQDLRQETRFTASLLLHDHGVVSGMSIIIYGVDRPFGVFGVHTRMRRTFTRNDVHFLQAVVNILSDAVERKSVQAQTRLQSSALKAAADSIVITDRDGYIQWVNPACSRLTGYELDEVLGKTPRIFKSGKQDQAYYKNLWDTILAGNTWYGELYNKRKDGSLYLEEESITPVLDRDGKIGHFIAIQRDISERQQLQRQLQQAQKMEAIGQLTGGIAHDFNNMLASIMGFTELAREALGQSNDEEIKDYLSEIYTSGARARDLVSQMLAFSRGGEGDLKPLALALLIKESLKMLGSVLPSSIEMDLQLNDEDLIVMTNPVHSHQLLMNLCINARDAMQGKGHISIGLRRVNAVVTVCSSCHEGFSGDYIEFSVRDTGSGIKPEQLNQVFDPFYTTKEVGKGTGMGLSMVHGIMHDHGGHIVVETVLGKGSTFALLFPVIDAQADVVNKEDIDANTSSVQTLDGNILIVDDEVSVGHFIGELLESYGCHVSVESDSRAALSKFKQNPQAFDLLVTDQTMPGMTGVELARAVLAIRPELPIILCTGYSEQIDASRAGSLGISGYVSKPIETGGFLGLVKDLLQARGIKPEGMAVN